MRRDQKADGLVEMAVVVALVAAVLLVVLLAVAAQAGNLFALIGGSFNASS